MDVLMLLEQALGYFTTLQALDKKMETLYIQARIYNQLGMTAERNRAARLYRAEMQRKASAMLKTTDMLDLNHSSDPSYSLLLCHQCLADGGGPL